MNARARIYAYLLKRFRQIDVLPVLATIRAQPWNTPALGILKQAVETVPYYRGLGVDLNHAENALSQFPVLTKDIIRREGTAMQADGMDAVQTYENCSGGSTGEPVKVVQDIPYSTWSLGTQMWYYDTVFQRDFLACPTVMIWGSERDMFRMSKKSTRVIHWLTQTHMINSFTLSADSLQNCIEQINRRKPSVVRGYAGSLYEVAKFAQARGQAVHQPRAILSAAETLRPFMRETIEAAFDCKVFDFYGSREVGPIAAECTRGNLHSFPWMNHVEVVSANGEEVAPGEEGEILVTTLRNLAMPLIRFRIGDTAVKGTCGCGLPGTVLERVTGRVSDHFVTRDGRMVHGEFFTHLMYFQPWVREFQIVQLDYDCIQINYIRDVSHDGPSEAVREDIEAKIRIAMGDACHVEWRETDEIDVTPQGKRLFTKSLVDSAVPTACKCS